MRAKRDVAVRPTWETDMSLEKKSVHVKLPPEIHERLSIMSTFYDKDMTELSAKWLEKVIVGEFHDFMLAKERMNRLGS
jgi:predicted DNA-binding protein